MEWIKELAEFLWAVIDNWAGYATGGVIVGILWLWSTYFQKSVSKRWGIALAVFFLTIAVFNAWREQHQRALTAQKKLDDLTQPKLEASDIGYSLGTAGENGKDLLATMGARIDNKGAPTVLNKWKVAIKFNDGRALEGLVLTDPFPSQMFTLSNPQTKSPIMLQGALYLPAVTRINAITPTKAAGGWISALFGNLDVKEIDNKASLVTYFSDVNGKEWSFEAPITPDQPEILRLNDVTGIGIKPLK